jgi:hypothetical protein
MIALPVLLSFCAIALASAFAFPDHRHRKLLVGSIGLGISIAMYASPLIVMVSFLFFFHSNFICNLSVYKRKQRHH